MCTFSQNKNRNRVRNGRIESALGASSAGNGNSGPSGSCKWPKWSLELASAPQWRSKWALAPASGAPGRPKLPCGPLWEPDGALGLPGNPPESQRRSKWWLTPASETQGLSALESAAQRCCLYSFVPCITFPLWISVCYCFGGGTVCDIEMKSE